MDEISERLLALMRAKSYVPRTLPELALELGMERKDLPRVKKAVFDMLKNGNVARVKGDRYGASADLDLVGGTVEFKQNGWARLVPAAGGDPMDIRPEDTWVALNGDKVLARVLFRSAERQPQRGAFGKRKHDGLSNRKLYNISDYGEDKKYAKVIRILERKNAKVTGTLKRSYNFWHVVPDDPRFFYDVIVADPEKSNAFPKPQENDKVTVRLNEWTQRHMNPTGEILENLGVSHTPMAEYRAILAKYDLEETFPEHVMAEVANTPSEVSKRDIDGRLDLRKDFVITIDPEDAKDFDDAVSISAVKNGWLEVGVHIADVSYYVRTNSQLDKEARKRGNSTYLVGTVIPMLPFELSNGICSLVEDKDRLVKSAFITFDATGDCKGVRFANSVMRSAKRLSYEQAYALMKEDDIRKAAALKPPADYETAFAGKPLSSMAERDLLKLRETLRSMWTLASTLRKKRMRKGSLDLDVPEFKIFCDKDGYADRIQKIDNNESHQMIEEFMLAANEAVARELFSNHIPYISRVHDDPDQDKLFELRDELDSFGIICGDLTSRREIIRVLAEISAHPQSYILKSKFLRSLKRAMYRASADGHYGLNKVYYSHFTSPIRRYADLTTHRAMNWLMKKNGLPTAPKAMVPAPSKGALDQTAELITRTEQNSAEAERESRKIKLMEFFERAIGSDESFEAVVTSVMSHGFFVELTESMAYGFVHVHTMRDDIYRLNDRGNELRGRHTGNSVKVGDRVRVEVELVDRFKRQIDFHLAGALERSAKKRKHGRRH